VSILVFEIWLENAVFWAAGLPMWRAGVLANTGVPFLYRYYIKLAGKTQALFLSGIVRFVLVLENPL